MPRDPRNWFENIPERTTDKPDDGLRWNLFLALGRDERGREIEIICHQLADSPDAPPDGALVGSNLSEREALEWYWRNGYWFGFREFPRRFPERHAALSALEMAALR